MKIFQKNHPKKAIFFWGGGVMILNVVSPGLTQHDIEYLKIEQDGKETKKVFFFNS